jgi:hypothetical protein
MNRLGIIFGVVAVVIAAWSLSDRPTASAQVANQSQMDGFNFQDIRFDQGAGPRPQMPRVSRLWKFVAVSNGERPNSNRLWFQDSSGNIITLSAYTTSGVVFVDPRIQILHAGN